MTEFPKNYREIRGDVFDYFEKRLRNIPIPGTRDPDDYFLIQTISGDCMMEAGIAREINKRCPEFIKKNKDSCGWNEHWTIKQFIKLNVSSNNRAITKYSEKLKEANEYLLQIENALKAIDESLAVEEHFYRLREKYINAVKELKGRR